MEFLGQGGSYTYRQVAILDLTERNDEPDSSRVRACRHILQVTGVPYVETANLNEALNHQIVFISPRIYSSTFNEDEILAISEYVNGGGTLIASNNSAPELNSLFGILDYQTDNLSKRFIWNIFAESNYFDRIDDPREIFVSLGDTTNNEPIFNHKLLMPAGGVEVLANYENYFPALIKKETGLGRTFLFGVDFKDIVGRNLLNRDLEAQRNYSNSFEPTTDTFIFFILNIIRKHMPSNVRWHTCPSCQDAVFILTHDIDSQTAIDTLSSFVTYENNLNLNATYFQTVRYVNDDWMNAFYTNNNSKIANIIANNQRLGSHSVGHFPDFNEDYIPVGSPGNTMANYTPYYLDAIGQTTGASVYGECEISKFHLENDFNVPIHSFRAGHHCYHERLPKVLSELGYRYDSSLPANDVLTNFPFFMTDERIFGGELTNVLEIPITISDGSSSFPINLDNYPSNVARWKIVTIKNAANGAPTVLQIHPNRSYKLLAQQNFFSQLPYGIKYMFIDDFGDYWRERINSRLYSDYNPVDSTMGIFLMDFNPEKEYAVIIDNYTDTTHCKFYDGFGNRLYPCITPGPFDETRFCNFQYNNPNENYCSMPYTVEVDTYSNNSIKIFPNPTTEAFTIESSINDIGKTVQLYDALGNLILEKNIQSSSERINVTQFAPGVYSVRFAQVTYRLVIQNQQ
ncbi:MAG: hypothetical protein RLZZ91_2018 [Bacteroidota bacterium]